MADYSKDYEPGKDYMKTRYSITGWGQQFQQFMNSDNLYKIKNITKSDSVFVDDRARGERSTRLCF